MEGVPPPEEKALTFQQYRQLRILHLMCSLGHSTSGSLSSPQICHMLILQNLTPHYIHSVSFSELEPFTTITRSSLRFLALCGFRCSCCPYFWCWLLGVVSNFCCPFPSLTCSPTDNIPYKKHCHGVTFKDYSSIPTIITAIYDTLIFLAISWHIISYIVEGET